MLPVKASTTEAKIPKIAIYSFCIPLTSSSFSATCELNAERCSLSKAICDWISFMLDSWETTRSAASEYPIHAMSRLTWSYSLRMLSLMSIKVPSCRVFFARYPFRISARFCPKISMLPGLSPCFIVVSTEKMSE